MTLLVSIEDDRPLLLLLTEKNRYPCWTASLEHLQNNLSSVVSPKSTEIFSLTTVSILLLPEFTTVSSLLPVDLELFNVVVVVLVVVDSCVTSWIHSRFT